MAKISLILHCQLDNGKGLKLPGEVVSLEEGEAKRLLTLNMAELADTGAKQAKSKGKAANQDHEQAQAESQLAPDALTHNLADALPDGADLAGLDSISLELDPDSFDQEQSHG